MPEPDPNADQSPEEIPLAVPVAQIWTPPPVAPPPPSGYAPPPPPYGYPYHTAGYTSVITPGNGRPGIVSAIGIMSIVVASLTLITCLIVAGRAVMQSAMASASVTMAAYTYTSQQQMQAQQAAIQPLPAADEGLPLDDRQVVINVMASRLPLSVPHQAQLDALLANGGKAMIDGRTGAITSDDVRQSLKSASRGPTASEAASPPDYFTLVHGRAELYDDHAVFRPDDRSAPIVRVQADVKRYTAAQNAPTQPPQYIPPPPPPPVAATAPATPVPPLDHAAQMSVIGEAGVSLLLAIFLLVTGILTLRNVRATGRMHWIYVVLKVPLVVLAIAAAIRYQRNLSAIIAAGTGSMGTRFPVPTSDFAINVAVLAAAYLFLLAVLLLMPATRDYYRKSSPSTAGA